MIADAGGRLIVQRHDSPLGRWTLAVLLPQPRLADAVEFLWCVEGGNAYEVAHPAARQRPTLFNLGAPQRLLDIHGVRAPQLFREAWISGQQQRFLDVDATGPSAILGVRFQPLGAWRVLGIPQHELAEQVLDLDAVLGDGIRALRAELLETEDPARRLLRFEQWLLQGMDARGEPHYAVRWALRRLRESHGQVEVQALAAELGYSRKHLAQLFQREAGLTPKALAQVLRFSHTLSKLRGTAAPVGRAGAGLRLLRPAAPDPRIPSVGRACARRRFLRRAAIDDESISEAHPAAS